MGTKIWFLLTVVALVQSKDLSEGSDDSGTNTKKIFDENKKANPAIWRQVDNITITGDEGAKINKILVTDLREEKDGEAKIVEGGIGQRNVTIELKSPTALRGYDFHIEVYANSDNSQASTSHDASKQKANPAKSSDENKPVNAVPIVPISLIRDELPSTSEQPKDSLKENKRQNRDAEDKDKLNKQYPHSFTDVTTKVPELKSTGIPATNKDKREDKVSEQGITNHQIHLQESPKMPESTARSIPTREIKIAEEKHNHQETRNNDENKKPINFDSNEKQTNINYSQFNVREVTPNVPVNAQSPTEEGHKRHARDVNQNTPAVETTEQPLPSVTSRNQGSTTTKVISDATHIENSPAVPTEEKQNKDHVQVHKIEEKTIHEHHNHNNRFSGRYIPDRFARNPTSASKRETSTEINKVSTIASTNVNTAQSSTPVIPKIIVNDQPTTKPETTTGKKVNSDINSELHINTNKESTSDDITANKRVTRETTDKNNKEQPSALPAGNIEDSPTSTLKPELNGFKAPVEASEKDKEIKHETPKANNSENTDNQRNIRDTEDNKEKINNLSSSTTKPDSKESHEKVSTDKTPVPVPIQLKSTQEVKTQPKNAQEKERIARDIDIKKSHNDEKLSSPTDATGIETEKGKKSNEKVTVEYQSLISTIKGNKKEEKAPTTAASNEHATKSEITPKIGENNTQNGDLKNLPGKFTREIKNIEGPSIIEEQNNKNDLSPTNTPLVDKTKVEPKQPEKSLIPPQ